MNLDPKLFPNLRLLCAAFLGYDWPDDYGDEKSAVKEFVSQCDARQLSEVAREISMLVDSSIPDGDIRRLLDDDLGIGYNRSADYSSERDWLNSILRVVNARIGV